MSWASSEWKDGLPARALQKIGEYESQLERMKKELGQKEFQLDSLKQACDTKNIRYIAVCKFYMEKGVHMSLF